MDPLPSHDRIFLDHPHAVIGATSPSTSVPLSSINWFIHARSDLINLAQSPSVAVRYTPRGISICSRSIPIPWNLYAHLKDTSQMAGGLSRAAMRRMGCRYTTEQPNTKDTEHQERQASFVCLAICLVLFFRNLEFIQYITNNQYPASETEIYISRL